MKKLILFSFISFSLLSNIFASSGNPNSTQDGFFSNPVKTSYGIIASNELQSALYLIHDNKVEELVNAPGCGRYFTLNKEGNKIGFKLIDAGSALQAPAIYDLVTKEVIKLSEPAVEAGQVSFAQDGTIAFSIGKEIFVKTKDGVRNYNIGVYSNRTPISPDAKKIVFKDESDQLWLLNLEYNTKIQISDPKSGYGNAVWSPNGKFIAYTTTGTQIFVYDVDQNSNYSIAEGENPSWSEDSQSLVFHKRDIDFNNVKLINSDIYMSNYNGSSVVNLTNTPNINEMDAKFSDNSKNILFHTQLAREIKTLDVESSLKKATVAQPVLLFKSEGPLSVKTYQIQKSSKDLMKSTGSYNWVHVHQVWDTEDSGNWGNSGEGYRACGATTAVELLASYGIIAPWPFSTYGHTSNYGQYVSKAYTIDGYTFQNFTTWPTGAHGFMWNDGGSPYSNMINFFHINRIFNTNRKDEPSWGDMAAEFNAGFPYIICSTGLTAGHIVLVLGQYGSGHTVVVNDPYGDKNVGSYGAINNGEKAIYDWSDGNTGRVQITPAAWGVAARYEPDAIPSVLSHTTTGVDSLNLNATISVNFSQKMDQTATQNAISITPSIKGTYTWSNYGQTLTFKPDSLLTRGTTYTFKIDTSAKSFWSKALPQAYSFSVIAKDRTRLNIIRLYPAKNQQSVSTTVQINVLFDSKVINFAKYVQFTDSLGKSIAPANVKLATMGLNNTLFSFEPKYPLSYNSLYKITLLGTFVDVNGYMLTDTVKVNFRTESQPPVDGSVIDDFETEGHWKNPSYSGTTTGLDTLVSKFSILSEKKVGGANCGKIFYSFTKTEGGLCRVYNDLKPSIGTDEKSTFGIWVFGDLSFNTLEYWFYDNANQNQTVFVDTLNWTGWRFKQIPVSKIGGSGPKKFHSLLIRQNAGGNQIGAVYFDNMQIRTVTSVENNLSNQRPTQYLLSQNYPNPFNPSTRISYSIPETGHVKLIISDILGKEVKSLVNEVKPAGNYTVQFDASALPSGVYIYTIKAGQFRDSKKLLLLK
ncbi:MAG: Ig-like domain-containing protein [Bacteroidota bacterium]|nr:Ig-like domain-containing protein [Bacteroidota bacterium]